MSAASVLKTARHMLDVGLAPRDVLERCCDRHGRPCAHSAEEVVLFSVNGALLASSTDEADVLAAWSALEQVHAPVLFAADEMLMALPREASAISDDQVRTYVQLVRAAAAAKETYLHFWLERPWRRLAEVLNLFDLAISRANAREAA